METKKITLRSQTVKCPHCGEYYSVTYKYCPFCDAGRQEEERRLAEKKKKKQAFFANLFGGGHEEGKADKSTGTEAAQAEPKKKSSAKPAEEPVPEVFDEGPDLLAGTPIPRPEPKPRKHKPKTAPKAAPAAEGVEIPLEGTPRREHSGKTAAGKTAGGHHAAKSGKSKKPAPAPEPELTELPRHRRRKKTSEMTEEEKAIDRAEREARAAARKRERDRKAALAAEAAKQAEEAKKAAEAKQAEEAAAQEVPAEAPAEPSPAETASAAPAAQESPAPEAVPQEPAEPAQPVNPTFIEEMPDQMPLVGSGPVFDEVMVPDSFGFDETIVSTDPAILNEPTTPAAPVGPVEKAPAPAAVETPAAPVVTESPEEAAARQQWAELRDLEQLPQTEVPAAPEAAAPAQEPSAPPAAPVPEEAAPAAPAEAPAAPEDPDEPAPEKPVETEEDLDALLNEIRDLLVSSPVPRLSPGELEKPEVPAEPEPEVQLSGDQMAAPEYLPEEKETASAAEEAPAETVSEPEMETPAEPVEETPFTAPAVDEPTIAMGKLDLSDPLTAPVDEALYDDQPTQVIPTQEIVEELEAKADAEVEEDELDHELPAAVLPPRRTAAAPEMKAHESKRRARAEKPAKAPKPVKAEKAPKPEKAEKAEKPEKSKKAKKQGSATLPLIIVSLIIIIAAAVIVFHKVLPTLQNGIFASQSAAAESLTLDQTEVSLAEAGTAVTLVPTFSPDGSTGTVTWTSSDEKIAAVDEAGTVTAVAPGTVTITAALENGAKAECKVSCTWTADTKGDEKSDTQTAENGGGEGAEQPQEAAKPALNNNDITLSSEGATQQLTVENASGNVTWSSSDDAIAKVAADGTVTAVSPGRATVTAKIGEQTFNCAVRCVW